MISMNQMLLMYIIDVHALSFPARGQLFMWDDRIRRYGIIVTKNVNQLNLVANLATVLIWSLI